MTGNNLLDMVARMGHESTGEVDDKIFFCECATSALREINMIRPAEKRITLNHPDASKADESSDARYTAYDMSKIVDDFRAFAAPPVREGGRASYVTQDYILDGAKLLLPSAQKGEYDIWYQHMISELSVDSLSGELEVASDLVELIPYLTAYLFWGKDEPEVANAAKKRYDELLIFVRRRINRACGYEAGTWG